MDNDFEFECPYCGEPNAAIVDEVPKGGVEMTQDCEVCCKPILLKIEKDSEGGIFLTAEAENQ